MIHWDHLSPPPKQHIDRFSRFCTDDRRASVYFTMNRLSLNIASSYGGYGPPSNTWFLGPTRVLNPNSISIDSAVFARLTTLTDRQTDRRTDRQTTLLGLYSVTTGRIYVRTAAMRPNNMYSNIYGSVIMAYSLR